jgi:hypothetical protein
MVIERDARRFVYDLIEQISSKSGFVQAISALNSVANVQGQGRSDFSPQLLDCAVMDSLSLGNKQVKLL